MAYKHGIYITETESTPVSTALGTAGPQVIIGTAPVHLTDNPSAAVNTPIYCETYDEAVEALGYSDDWASYTLCQAMDASFKMFGVGPVIFINVLDPASTSHTTSNTSTTLTPASNKALYEVTGVILSSVVVKSGTTTTLTLGTDYTLERTSADNIQITLISESAKAATSLTVTSKSLKPSGVTAADIIGGTNPTTGAETGLALLRQIYPKFGVTAGLLLAPGWSQNQTVAAAMQAACEGINECFSCEALIDLDCGASGAVIYSGVAAQKTTQGLTSAHAIALWPKVKTATHTYYHSAIFGALCAYVDIQNDNVPSHSPSNKALASPSNSSNKITALVLESGAEVVLDQAQANVVNGYGIVTAQSMGGFRSWGNNTCAYPESTTTKSRWINVRRMFSYWSNLFIKTFYSKVDDLADYRLIESIVDAWNVTGNQYVANGHCAAAKISFLESENPVANILAGTIKFNVSFTPYTPAENIQATLQFDPTALATALTNGGE